MLQSFSLVFTLILKRSPPCIETYSYSFPFPFACTMTCFGFTTPSACASFCQNNHQQVGYNLGQQGLCMMENCQDCAPQPPPPPPPTNPGEPTPPPPPPTQPVTDCLGKPSHESCAEECNSNYATYGFGSTGACVFEACGAHLCNPVVVPSPPVPPTTLPSENGNGNGNGSSSPLPWIIGGVIGFLVLIIFIMLAI